MKLKKSVLVLLTVVISAYTTSDIKNINVADSIINWVGYKVTGQHEGTINLLNGSLNFKDNVLVGGKFVMDMTTINTTDIEGDYKNNLEGHLKSDDFFGVEKHGTSALNITNVKSTGKNSYQVKGDLKIKGISKSMDFQVSIYGNKASANLKVDRTDFGIKYGSGSYFEDLQDKMIYDEFDLNIDLEF